MLASLIPVLLNNIKESRTGLPKTRDKFKFPCTLLIHIITWTRCQSTLEALGIRLQASCLAPTSLSSSRLGIIQYPWPLTDISFCDSDIGLSSGFSRTGINWN